MDVAGNLVRTTDRAGKVIEYSFDALDRSTAERWQASTTTPTLSVATTQQGGVGDEQQSVGWSSTAMGMSGTFTLTQNGQTTSSIAWDASAATIQAALEALSSVGAGNVLVSVTATNMVSRSISLTFRNGKAGINLPQTTINTSSLFPMMGGGVTSFANTTVEGGAYQEIQTITLSNATSGTWRVAYNGEISSALSTSITAADLKTALDAFIGIDNVTVTGSSGSFTVTFGGTQSTTNMSQIFGDAASASCGATISTITSTYDANDQLTSISDPSATINFTLDNLGRATSISNTIAGLTPTVTLAQNFNAAANRTELKATIGSALDFKNTYQFDTLGRVTEMIQQSQAGGNAVTAKRAVFEYNKLNQRTSLTRYQSTGTSNFVAATDYTYDTVNRLSGLTHKQSSTVLAGYTYGYDGLSRLTSVTSTIEGLSTYTYDATSQVVGADHAVGGQADETYGYDLNGNRNTSGYTTSTNNHTTADPGFTYTYDDQGNRTSRTETSTGKVTEYTWDHRNRLVTVKDRNTAGGSVVKQVDYAYDAFNRLVKRTFDADGAGAGAATNQFWVYDEGINAVLQFDGSSASNLSHRYLWSDRVDELLADETVGSGADTLYALSDHLGTIRDIANFNESTSVTSVTNHRTYNSFGKLVSETNAAVDLIFGYTGKQLDEATGLQHNLFRWYDSGLGQWVSEDPVEFAAGDENLKRYVGNGGTLQTDPSGLFAFNEVLNHPVIYIPTQTYLGFQQGGMNLLNGLTDMGVGILNMPSMFVNSIAYAEEQVGILNAQDKVRLSTLTAPDWSKDWFVNEDPTSHNISKISGAIGVTVGFGAWQFAARAVAAAVAVNAQRHHAIWNASRHLKDLENGKALAAELNAKLVQSMTQAEYEFASQQLALTEQAMEMAERALEFWLKRLGSL